jgi:carboxymethylenebutenolidase
MADAMTAETITVAGHGGDRIEAYLALPLEGDRRGSVVVIHRVPRSASRIWTVPTARSA